MGNEIEDKFRKMGARVKVVSDRLAALSIDIRRDKAGEYFDVRHDPAAVAVQVVDVRPGEVWSSIRRHGVAMKHRDRRRTDAFLRQGEWFFLPRPWLTVDDWLVLKDEPMRRGAGKPHRCEFLYRIGGQAVYVHERHPSGVTLAEWRELPEAERNDPSWRLMQRDARVFVKGSVRHPDHATIRLPYWHQVVMNTETSARAMRNVAFLD